MPSSTNVTAAGDEFADAAGEHRASFTMWSASRPCPHASWNRMPPVPLLMTTGSTPDGAGRADSFDIALRAARSAASSTGVVLEHLEAERERERV